MGTHLKSLWTNPPWPTVMGALVSATAVVLGLRFGAAGLAGTIAIGLFALFVSAAVVSARRQHQQGSRAGTAHSSTPGSGAGEPSGSTLPPAL